MATPSPTPKYNPRDPASSKYYFSEIKNRLFKDRPFTEQDWANMSDMEKEILKNALIALSGEGSKVSVSFPTMTPTPSEKKKTPTPTPTPTPTGGFAYLMSPDGTKQRRVPWGEVADLIRAGWHEIE